MGPDVFLPTFWETRWTAVRKQSILQQTQADVPDRWNCFFDSVSDIWLDMIGEGERLAEEIADLLLRESIVHPDDRALDLGCGPGALSICLAKRGVRVTGLDTSIGMLSRMNREAERQEVAGLMGIQEDWKRYRPETLFDIVIGSFFPPALSPEGIRRVESLSRKSCVLVMGTGNETFPVRSALWGRLMAEPMPRSAKYLICAVNYLMVSGRSPNLVHMSVPVERLPSVTGIRQFYRSYFSLFGVGKSEIEAALDAELAGYSEKQQAVSGIRNHVAVLWWSAFPGNGEDPEPA
jgi:SAM-dependent methyltransferase